MSFDAYAFLLTDPATTVGCSPLAEVPDLAKLPDLIRLKYLTSVNRWTGLPMSGCASLQQATGGRPEQSLLWREDLAELGVLDVVSMVFTDRFPTNPPATTATSATSAVRPCVRRTVRRRRPPAPATSSAYSASVGGLLTRSPLLDQ